MSGKSAANRWLATRPLLRRLLQYREWLRSGRGFTTIQAVEEMEVCERTVYRDMEYVRTLGWDVAFCRTAKRWVRVSGDLAMPLISLRQGEVVALLVAEQALRAYEGTPYAAALRSAFAKIIGLLDAPVTLEVSQADLPRFTGPPARPVEVQQHEQLLRACQQRRRLEIAYYTPKRDEVTTRRIDPYHLFAHGPDWYLVAYCHLRERFTTFALGGRMREVRPLGETFAPDPEFDFDRYTAEGFGLFRGGPVEDVTLRFSPAVARYLREKVWDETEWKEELADGSLLLKMRVPINIGLLRFVLQYGAEVEVLAPEGLRAQVAEEWRRAGEAYQ